VGYFEQALSALEHLPETRDTSEQAIALRLALRPALRPLGDFRRFLVYLREAKALACTHPERGNQAYAIHLLGEIAARRDPPEAEQAKAHYREALALANALSMRPLQAHCHRGLGTLYGRVGREPQARAALSTAIALYWSMEMAFWLPQAEAALAQVEVASAPQAG
jgi:tetratricopeptide (TPR) repeat protein